MRRDIQKLRGAHEQQEGSQELNMRVTGGKTCDDNPSFCCIPIVTEGSDAHSDQLQQGHQGPVSRIWT